MPAHEVDQGPDPGGPRPARRRDDGRPQPDRPVPKDLLQPAVLQCLGDIGFRHYPAHALQRIAGVCAAAARCRSSRLEPMVELYEGCRLAARLRPQEQHQHAGQPSGRSCVLRRCRRIRQAGRKGYSHCPSSSTHRRSADCRSMSAQHPLGSAEHAGGQMATARNSASC
ncbi:MAG: hypothetical protein JWR89_732 [Tardiphaga sp.]|nr:hypothetical protein [Tardiphaga sp.]